MLTIIVAILVICMATIAMSLFFIAVRLKKLDNYLNYWWEERFQIMYKSWLNRMDK